MEKDLDRKIENDINKILRRELKETSKDINIQSRNGFVTLSGFVDVLAEKNAAGELSANVYGVKSVENCITLSTDGTITDKEIEAEVIDKLKDSDGITFVGTKVQRGTVVLEGTVNTLKDKNDAIHQAMKAFGVKDVVSHIDIDSIKQIDDVTIHNRIEQQLVNIGLNNQDIRVNVENGAVNLSGYVNTINDMEVALEITEGVEGVRTVKNYLKFREEGK